MKKIWTLHLFTFLDNCPYQMRKYLLQNTKYLINIVAYIWSLKSLNLSWCMLWKITIYYEQKKVYLLMAGIYHSRHNLVKPVIQCNAYLGFRLYRTICSIVHDFLFPPSRICITMDCIALTILAPCRRVIWNWSCTLGLLTWDKFLHIMIISRVKKILVQTCCTIR